MRPRAAPACAIPRQKRQPRAGREARSPTRSGPRRRRAAQGHDIFLLLDARRRDQLTELFGALDVTLTAAHLSKLAGIFPPGVAAGER
jgi:hypothetical protein